MPTPINTRSISLKKRKGRQKKKKKGWKVKAQGQKEYKIGRLEQRQVTEIHNLSVLLFLLPTEKLLIGKFVANSPDSFNVLGLARVCLDMFPQSPDVYINSTRSHETILPPHIIE
jgi:hypothetical protein